MAAAASETIFGFEVLLDKELGSGSFGTVLEAIRADSREIVAVKKITRTGSANFAKTASREAVNFQKLPKDHENIIKVFDTKYKEGSLYIFMEKCNSGDLNKYFATHFSLINVKHKINLMSQIADGLAYLHSQRIVHRDIKPANILINETSGQSVAKITDFGLSKFLTPEDTSLMTSNVGTAAFMAPEFWNQGDDGKISYRSSVDVFAAGLVYLAMLQATEGSTLRPSAEESVGGSTEGSKHIGLVMYMRSSMNQPTLNVVALRPGDSSTIRKVKKMISNMTSFDPNERPKAADLDRLLKAIVTLIDFETNSDESEQFVENTEFTQYKPPEVTINKVKQWNLEYAAQLMHVTKYGHIYTANPFGKLEVRDLSGKLLYQWMNIKLYGITSVVVNRVEYVAVVVRTPEKCGTSIMLKPSHNRSPDPGSWNILAYETDLETEIKTPLAMLQNGLIAIAFVERHRVETGNLQVHILDCNSIPFKCVNTLDFGSGKINSLCGIKSNSGEQMIPCVTAFDGVKRPVVVYSLDNKKEEWRFTGQKIQNSEMGRKEDETAVALKEKSGKHAKSFTQSFSPILNIEEKREMYEFQLSGVVLPLASSVLRRSVSDQMKTGVFQSLHTNFYPRFVATDLCAVDDHNLFIAESENHEVLLVDCHGALLSKVLTKEDLGNLAVDFIQCTLPSRYLVTICSPRSIKGLGNQMMIIWRFRIN